MSSIGKSSTQILLARITKDIQVHVLEREALEVKQAKGLASQQEVERISELKVSENPGPLHLIQTMPEEN